MCERELHYERCVGGMKEGIKKTWEVTATWFDKTTQNSIHVTKPTSLSASPLRLPL